MKKATKILSVVVLLLVAGSCGNKSPKENNASINDKKTALEKLKKAQEKNELEIKKLEDELAILDTGEASAKYAKLVAIAPVTIQNFQHFIELRGKIDADNISAITPRMGPAQVKAVYVRQGQLVKKGQLLLKLDDAILRQSVTAARRQTDGIKTQLNFAKNVYQRQKNLWDKGIGTEVQLITAKTNVESLENQLSAANEQIKVAQEQLNTSNVISDVTGIADEVNIRVGEIFSGMNAQGVPQIKIVNTSNLKAVTNVAENYISRLHTGTPVVISLPDVNKTYNSVISFIGQSIGNNMIGFVAEAKLPKDAALKPNQTAIIKIQDYAASNALVIPVNTVQNDEKGKYVYVLQKSSNGQLFARKKNINIGEAFGEMVEVKTGLSAGEQLITEGYQDLYEGQQVITASN
ncbi:MAG TPA: efflux RND transporter periplasmic adaptor subunit [Ferruginibacter sp.]|nr:efflux RND transporter periplasmic adaptor subunit [Bacteroidota bacterium]MBS1926702.1 efflux RND transporter periplasmic adaptor subunit [Bacteroidota bacterium]MCC6693275.1 efflux RND transporter periplasmic adaptor subunit [Chitinophagaceae bacterium]HMT95977.1 efflux RND transporter periplasmic adaptor subunit [Ferruginibacter sp.]HMU24290.1 efflux RND transporter periplasmic adaptor subunit [Ferruginibacter sp.]